MMRWMRKRKWLVIAAVSVIASGAGFWWWRKTKTATPAKFAVVQRETLTVAVREVGTIEPLVKVAVKSKVAGRIMAIHVQEGDFVRKGQVIAIIDPTEIERQVNQVKAELTAAEARWRQALLTLQIQETLLREQWEQAQADLIAAQANLEKLMAGARAEEIEAAEANVRKAKAQLEAAKANEAVVEQRRAEVVAARAALAQAEAAYKQALANAQQVKLREADIKTAKSQVQRALAQLRNARIQLADTVIVAPRDGVIIEKLVEEGTVISSGMSAFAQGTTIVRLADMSRVFVDAEVAEADIASVWVGQKVDVTVDAFPGEIFEGKVVRVDPRTTVEQNVVYVHVLVELDMPDERLKPGMSATCEFQVERKENVLAVPNEAIKEDEQGRTYVEIAKRLNPHPEIERRYVEIGLQGTTMTEIVKGLKEGEVVVTLFATPQQIQPQMAFGPGMRGMMGTPMGGMRGLMRR